MQQCITLLGKAQQDHTAVARIALALEKSAIAQAVGQADGAMMLNQKPSGDVPDGGLIRCLYRQQKLMLLRLEAFAMRGIFAEAKEAADLVTELRESAVVLRVQNWGIHINIVIRSTWTCVYCRSQKVW